MRKFLIPLMFLASLAITACDKSGGGSSASTPGSNYWQSCANCQMFGQGPALLTAVKGQTTDGGLQFSLDLQGQSGGMPAYGNPKAVVYYQGPAAFTGYMRVNNSSLICGAMPGDYLIRPLQPSSMYALTVQGGQYEAMGPNGFRILFRLGNAVFYNNDGGGVSSASMNNRVGLNIILDYVNGSPCGSISTY